MRRRRDRGRYGDAGGARRSGNDRPGGVPAKWDVGAPRHGRTDGAGAAARCPDRRRAGSLRDRSRPEGAPGHDIPHGGPVRLRRRYPSARDRRDGPVFDGTDHRADPRPGNGRTGHRQPRVLPGHAGPVAGGPRGGRDRGRRDRDHDDRTGVATGAVGAAVSPSGRGTVRRVGRHPRYLGSVWQWRYAGTGNVRRTAQQSATG